MSKAYTVGVPVTGHCFYGRTALLRSLLSSYTAGWKWLCATRRVGKTSLLKQMQHAERANGRQVLFFSFSDLTRNEISGAGFLRAVIDCNEAVLDGFHIKTQDLVREDNGARGLRTLLERLRAAGGPVLLLLDEADELIRIEEQERGFLSQLRSYLHTLPGFELIMAASQELAELYGPSYRLNDFLGTFLCVTMGGLTPAESRALLCCTQTGGWVTALPPRQIERILTFAGGHPYVLQWLGNNLVHALEGRGDRLRDKVTDAAIADFIHNRGVRRAFEDDYSKLSPLQRKVLTALCQRESLGTAELAELTHQSRESIFSTGTDLAQLGYLYPEETGPAGKPWRLRFCFYRDLLPQVEPRSLITEADIARSRQEHRQRPTVVFIYNLKDEEILASLLQILTPGLGAHNVELWSERRLDDGHESQVALREVLRRSAWVVVLVSPDLVCSTVLNGPVVPAAIADTTAAVRLCPLFVRPSLLLENKANGSLLALLNRRTGLNSSDKPLSLLAGARLEAELVRLAKVLLKLLVVPPESES